MPVRENFLYTLKAGPPGGRLRRPSSADNSDGGDGTTGRSTRLGRHRWTIERTGAWLGGWRRLRIRYERSSERFSALAILACAVICFNALQQPPW